MSTMTTPATLDQTAQAIRAAIASTPGARAKLGAARFDAIDTNHDGKLSVDEVKLAVSKLSPAKQQALTQAVADSAARLNGDVTIGTFHVATFSFAGLVSLMGLLGRNLYALVPGAIGLAWFGLRMAMDSRQIEKDSVPVFKSAQQNL